MHFKFATVAIAALLASAAPASASTSFTFDAANPVSLNVIGDYFSFSYYARSIGAVNPLDATADATYGLNIKYFDKVSNKTIDLGGGGIIGGNIPASATTPNYNYGVLYSTPPYTEASDYTFTFSTTSNQKIFISSLTAIGCGYRGDACELNFRMLPEPSTWAMMLVGFGMMGFALRNRRSVLLSYN